MKQIWDGKCKGLKNSMDKADPDRRMPDHEETAQTRRNDLPMCLAYRFYNTASGGHQAGNPSTVVFGQINKYPKRTALKVTSVLCYETDIVFPASGRGASGASCCAWQIALYGATDHDEHIPEDVTSARRPSTSLPRLAHLRRRGRSYYSQPLHPQTSDHPCFARMPRLTTLLSEVVGGGSCFAGLVCL